MYNIRVRVWRYRLIFFLRFRQRSGHKARPIDSSSWRLTYGVASRRAQLRLLAENLDWRAGGDSCRRTVVPVWRVARTHTPARVYGRLVRKSKFHLDVSPAVSPPHPYTPSTVHRDFRGTSIVFWRAQRLYKNTARWKRPGEAHFVFRCVAASSDTRIRENATKSKRDKHKRVCMYALRRLPISSPTMCSRTVWISTWWRARATVIISCRLPYARYEPTSKL